jgi:hypothetical protein
MKFALNITQNTLSTSNEDTGKMKKKKHKKQKQTSFDDCYSPKGFMSDADVKAKIHHRTVRV